MTTQAVMNLAGRVHNWIVEEEHTRRDAVAKLSVAANEEPLSFEAWLVAMQRDAELCDVASEILDSLEDFMATAVVEEPIRFFDISFVAHGGYPAETRIQRYGEYPEAVEFPEIQVALDILAKS